MRGNPRRRTESRGVRFPVVGREVKPRDSGRGALCGSREEPETATILFPTTCVMVFSLILARDVSAH